MKQKQKKSTKSDVEYADIDCSSDVEEGTDVFEKFANEEVRPQHLPNLDLLQMASETLAAQTRRREFHLRCTLEGKSVPAWCLYSTASANGVDVSSNSNDSCMVPHSSASSTGSVGYNTVSERVAKTVPGKPLTLIISQRVRRAGIEDEERPPIKRSRLTSESPSVNSETTANGWPSTPVENRRALANPVTVQRPWRRGTPSSTGLQQTRQARPDGLPEVPEISSPNKHLYDIPNKFWALMEPYCADLTDENLRALDKMIKRYEDDSSLYKVPPLGEDSSSRRWPKDELSDSEIKVEPKIRNSHESDLTALLKRVDSEMRKPVSEPSQLSSAAQHMVSNLIEQNIMQPMCAVLEANDTENNSLDEPGTSHERRFALPTKSLARQLKVSNSFKLEKKIKKLLEKLGHFPINARPEEEDEGLDDDPSDEVLALLRRKQREFRLLSEYNRSVLRRVAQCVRRDLQRQEILRRLAIADADVIEAYNKIISYRQKNKTPSKRDRDLAWKTLRERKKILKELEEFNENPY